MNDREIVNLIEAFYKKNYQKATSNWKILVNEMLSEKKEKERLKILKRFFPITKETKILEIGSGFGNFTIFMKKNGYHIIGIEPDKDCLDIIKKRFSAAKLTNPVRPGIGEKTPFLKGQFDLVVSFQVLEHVKDPLKVIKESKRILKPGGCFYAAFPNYFSFWEPHYALLFPTFLGKKIFSFWLKILKKDRRFLDDLNFISAKSISRLLIKNSFIIKSTGKELFQERFDSQKMPKWGQTKALRKIVQLFCKMRLNYFLSTMLCKLNMHYPVNVVAYKR